MALQYKPLPPEVFNIEARPHIARLNLQLRELFALEGTIREPRDSSRSDSSVVRRNTTQVHVTRITPDIMDVVSGVSVVMGQPGLTFGLTNTIGSSTSAISVNSTIALFTTNAPPAIDASAGIAGLSSTAANLGHRHQVLTAAPTIDYSASAAAEGSTVTLLRSGATLLAPTFLRSTANASTLTLTDDATNQTLAGTLGSLFINAGGGTIFLDPVSSGGTAASIMIRPNSSGAAGLQTQYTSANLSSGTVRGWNIVMNHTSQLISSTFVGYDTSTFTLTPAAGSDAANVCYGARFFGPFISNGNAGFSEVATLYLQGARRLISSPTVTLAAGAIIECPTVSATEQVGTYIKQRTAQTVATDRIGLKIDAQNSGTNRYSIKTATDKCLFGGEAEIDGDLNHDGTNVGFYGTAPTPQSAAYTPTNVTADRAYDANATTVDELADVLGTLIADLQLTGIIA